jgi:hypothetical protein
VSQLDKKMNFLVAYPYFSKQMHGLIDQMNPDKFRLIIDSGAFSAYNSGVVINLDDYCTFLKAVDYSRFEASVQLDVVFNPKETKHNYQTMLDRGFNVCPVFTRGDSFDYFNELLEQKRYIFVGGVQQGVLAKPFAKKCLQLSAKDSRVHYLAFVKPDFLNHYRPYSVDSSTWSNSSQYGLCNVYRGGGRIRALNRKHFVKKPSEEIFRMFERMGFDRAFVHRFAKAETWNSRGFTTPHDPKATGLHMFVSVCSYIKYSIDAQNTIGTKIYNAIGSYHHLMMFNQAYQFLTERGVI